MFHRLIELGTSAVGEEDRVAKYRAALAPHAAFLSLRAGAFVRGARSRRKG